MRRLLGLILVALALGLGLGFGLRWFDRDERVVPDPPALAVQIREVARLEVLDVSLYKKVTFAPDPSPGETFWADLTGWARHTFVQPRGKAIVFAEGHVGLDLDKLGPGNVQVIGRTVYVVLPPLKVNIELKPGETEVIGSNLDSAETTELLELAKVAFEKEVAADPKIRERARSSAERAISSFLRGLGFSEVQFVDALPGAKTS